jgi:hypothetical protein
MVTVDRRALIAAIPALVVGVAQLASASSRVSAADTPTLTWLPTSTIQASLPSPAPDLAMSSGGRSLVAWTRATAGSVHLDASYRLAGAPGWPAADELNLSNVYTTPDVAIDGKGNAILVEPSESHSDNGVATARYYSAASRKWLPPTQLSPPGVPAQEVRVGMDEAGNAVAVWGRYSGDVPILEASYRPVSRGRWLPAVRLPSTPSVLPLSWQLSVAKDGSAIVAALVLKGTSPSYTEGIEAIVGTNGTWKLPAEITMFARGGYMVAAAAAPQGRALVAWDEYIAGNEVVRASSYTPGAGWGAPDDLSFKDGQACCPVVALDGSGNAVAVWDATVDVEASTRSGSGAWSRPVALSPPLHAGSISVATNASGVALAAWQGATPDYRDSLVQAASFLPASGWQTAATLADAAGGCCPSLSTGLDAAGDGAVVWDNWESTRPDGYELFSVQAALLDAGGPLLHAVYSSKPPVIIGKPSVGRRLTCRAGAWSGDRPITFSYRWLRNGHPAGSRQGYHPRRLDVGSSLRCTVTAANRLGSAAAISAAVRVSG